MMAKKREQEKKQEQIARDRTLERKRRDRVLAVKVLTREAQ